MTTSGTPGSDAHAVSTPAPLPRPVGKLLSAIDTHQRRSTARSWSAWATLIGVMTLAIAADLASKYFAFARVAPVPVAVDRARVLERSLIDPRAVTEIIPPHPPRVVIPHVLEFTLVLNPGAVFGMGPGQRWFFMGFTVLALGFGVWMFLRWTGPTDRWAHVGIAMLLGGGLGNLYDRVMYACVRDFIHPLPGLKWPFGWKPLGSPQVWPYVSNVADLVLLIGILMLLVILWKRDRHVG